MSREPNAPGVWQSTDADLDYITSYMTQGGASADDGWAAVAETLSLAPSPKAPLLTLDVKTALLEQGIVDAATLEKAETDLRDGRVHVELAAALILSIADAFTPMSLATYLGRSHTEIFTWVTTGRLIAHIAGDLVLIPSWQIDTSTEDGRLRGLEDIIAAITDAGVRDSQEFMLTPRRELRVMAAVSPFSWLQSGGGIGAALDGLRRLRGLS